MMPIKLTEQEEFEAGFEAEGEPPPMKPMTPGEIEFWWEEVDDDGKPIPPPRWKVN